MLFLFVKTSAWADTNSVIINMPQLIKDNDNSQTPGQTDFKIKNLRVCNATASASSASPDACPYSDSTDSSSGYNLTWTCSNASNCIYTNIKQSPTAKMWAIVNNNNVQIGYGETQATMVPLLQTTIPAPSGWVCQASADSTTVTCSPPIPTCRQACLVSGGGIVAMYWNGTAADGDKAPCPNEMLLPPNCVGQLP